MGSGPPCIEDAEGRSHDELTCRPVWYRHGRLRAWLFERGGGAPDAGTAPPPEQGEDARMAEGGDPRLPAWFGELPASAIVAVVPEEDLDRVHRHLGAMRLSTVLGEALVQLRDDARSHYLAVIGQDEEPSAPPHDELARSPLDDVWVLAGPRLLSLQLPRHLLDELLACELEPSLQPLVSWASVLPRAVRHYARFLDERAGREVPYAPSPPRACFRAAPPPPDLPSLEERRRWLAAWKGSPKCIISRS